MDVLSIVKRRRHIHHFQSEPVSDEMIRTLLEAVRWAPSAGNLQPWEIILLTSKDEIDKMVDALGEKEYMRSAPAIFVFCADLNRSADRYGERGSSLYAIQDTAAAIQNVLLTATSLGLGSGWVCAFDEKTVADFFGLPDNVRPLVLIMIGKSKENPTPPPRREVVEFTHVGEFGNRTYNM